MKIQEINGTNYLALPIAICRAKGWKKGDIIKYKINDKGEIVLFK